MAWACAVAAQEPLHIAPQRHFHVVHEYPHRTDAYTEGLVFSGGQLYESTGRVGHSALRRVNLATGEVLQEVTVPPPYFGEGLAQVDTRWLQLTWQSQQGFIYDDKLRRTGEFRYAGEGWGLTFDGRHVVMSSGSALLRLLDPADLRPVGRLAVFDGDREVAGLNELEYANGLIYANIWLTDDIAIINGTSGDVVGWLNLAALRDRFTPPPDWDRREDVLNGIAYDAASGHFFVTGKCWPKLFEISIDADNNR
jgi:glutaminyl-peptide cyclotransferase